MDRFPWPSFEELILSHLLPGLIGVFAIALLLEPELLQGSQRLWQLRETWGPVGIGLGAIAAAFIVGHALNVLRNAVTEALGQWLLPPGQVSIPQQGLNILFQRHPPTPSEYMAAWQLTRGSFYHIGELYGNSAFALLGLLWVGVQEKANLWSLNVAATISLLWILYFLIHALLLRRRRRVTLGMTAVLVTAIAILASVLAPPDQWAPQLAGALCGDSVILFSMGYLVIEADYRTRWQALRDSVR